MTLTCIAAVLISFPFPEWFIPSVPQLCAPCLSVLWDSRPQASNLQINKINYPWWWLYKLHKRPKQQHPCGWKRGRSSWLWSALAQIYYVQLGMFFPHFPSLKWKIQHALPVWDTRRTSSLAGQSTVYPQNTTGGMYRADHPCRKTLGPAGHNEHHKQVGTRQKKVSGSQRRLS